MNEPCDSDEKKPHLNPNSPRNHHRRGSWPPFEWILFREIYMTRHFLCLMVLPQRPFRLSRSAASNTSLTPLPVFALHSRYPAPMSLATAAPCSGVTGAWPCADSMRMVVASDRRSVLVPIRRRGVEGQKWDTSGYHFFFYVESERTLFSGGEEMD